MFVCPSSKLPLRRVSLAAARDAIADGAPLAGAERGDGPSPLGETRSVFLRSDDAVAFPVVDGVPLLMWPEVLTPPDSRVTVDLGSSRYAEAYAEIGHYRDVATEGLSDVAGTTQFDFLSDILQAEDRSHFPEPPDVWLDAAYDCTAQERVYEHIAPNVADATVVQVGGSGLHALKLLVAGASEALLVTPVVSEAQFGRQMAEELGFGARFHPVVGIGEELPLAAESCDAAVSGGCLHHMVTAEAGREIRRALKIGGRFGAWDPWRAPLYRAGITIFGKREPGVGCRPIDDERVAAFMQNFGPEADYQRHGALVRYPLIALAKFGISLDVRTTLPIFRRDDRLAGALSILQRLQSDVSICGERTG